MSGLSKADREIIAQGSDSDLKLNIKKLFRGEEADGIGKLPGTFDNESGPPKMRGRSMSARPPTEKESKGKMPMRSLNKEKPEDIEDRRFESDFNSGANWDRPHSIELPQDNDRMMLDWASFHWKPHESTFLRGITNWEAYKESLLIQLKCIGYESGMKLSYLDEIKLAAVIHRTVTLETIGLVSGIDRGTAMMKTFETTYRQAGELQEEALWSSLISLEYSGGCPVTYVTKFKTAVRHFEGTGTPLPVRIISVQFKLSVKAKSRTWHSTISAVARFRRWSCEQLYQDFIAHHHERIGQSNEPYDKSRHDRRGQNSLNNTQSNHKGKEPRRRWRVRCWTCKREGHLSKDCPEKNSDNEHSSFEKETKTGKSIGPPHALAAEYCEIGSDEILGSSFAAHVEPQVYDEMVNYYEKEIARRRRDSSRSEDVVNEEPPIAEINFTQQILSVGSSDDVKSRWLFDTGADIDATNNRQHFKQDTIVELKPKQFPIQTGNGVVYAESVGEVWLPLQGPNASKTVMKLMYVVYLRVFPLNIVSGERFYRSGGQLNGNRIISPTGAVLSFINTERRGFFLWLFNNPEPLKLLKPKKIVHYVTDQKSSEKEGLISNTPENLSLKSAYDACWNKGIFQMSEDVMRKLVLWHRRLCHPSTERLRWTIQNTVGIDLRTEDVKNLPCEACDMGKSVKHTTKERKPRMENVGEGWHCDVGTLNPISIDGYGYFCLTTEDLSRFRFFRALKTKNEAAEELKNILSTANANLSRRGLRVKQVTIDGGRDWGMSAFQEFADDLHIDVIVSAPDNQYQNGVSERSIRFVQDAARCCAIQMKIPSVFWNYMLEMACYTLNCTSQSPVKEHKTPWEVYWNDIDPTKAVTKVDHLWIPGTLCITHVDKNHRITSEKLDARGTRSVFFGYRGRTNKLVWLLDGGRFLVSPQVTAHESVGNGLGWAADPREIVRSLPKAVQNRLKVRKTDYARNEDYNRLREPSPNPIPCRGRGRPKRKVQRPFEDQALLVLEAPFHVDHELMALNQEGELDNCSKTSTSECYDAVTGRNFGVFTMNRHSKLFEHIRKAINSQLFSLHGDGDELFRTVANSHKVSRQLTSKIDQPSLKEAMSGSEKNKWLKAIHDEIRGCVQRDTFKFVENPLNNQEKRLVTAKWVLKKKYLSNSKLDKFKARIVARGFTQTKGIDFNETTATTARSASWRILMALAALNELYILQADFVSAYLAGELKETVFMEQFPYLKDYFDANPNHRKALNYSENSVIELKKPLYGLKQSGACWQEKIRTIMKAQNFTPLISDNAIYFNKTNGIIVASYVDDFLLVGPNRMRLQSLIASLNKEVALNDMGDAEWFLGMRIQRSSPTGSVRIDQQQYIEKSLDEFEIEKTRTVHTPMSVSSRSDMKRYSSKATAAQLHDFQRLVGKYNFSSCMLRCDTSQATSQMARYMCNPSPKHFEHMLRIAHYLAGCPNKGIKYQKHHRHANKYGEYGLHCAVDSSFADDHDTAKSTTGYVVFLAGNPVIWRSKLQSTVSTLTCEAEYAAIFEASKDCAWIRSFLTELGRMPPGPIPILEDNLGAIKWANDDGMSSGRRHVRVEYHYAVQEVRSGHIEVRHVPSGENPADGLTKPLDKRSFQRFVQQLGLDEKEVLNTTNIHIGVERACGN